MNTPKQMGSTETLAQISAYFAQRCRLDSAHKLTCAQCGSEIRRIRAYMSLHDAQFGNRCVGPGRAWRMEIPYCPACEEPPSRYGCIHMSRTDLGLPGVMEASRPFGLEDPQYRNQAPSTEKVLSF